MKTHRFELAKYFPIESDGSGNIYVDWPSIHRQAGTDCIQWINSQDPKHCQIIIEQRPEEVYWYAMLEIYSDKLATIYNLMWAK